MSRLSTATTSTLPPHQQAIWAKCFHPSGAFTAFTAEEVEQSIPERFEKVVRRFPERIAVKTATQVLTYYELNAMANRVAHALIAAQRSKAELVALLLEKDVPQFAAMLGVLKAGKFLLLLDPSLPPARLATMLVDCRAKRIVTDRHHLSLTREVMSNGCQLLEWEGIDGDGSTTDLGLKITPKALAFINYTSGSTGEPKGLLQTHKVILHNIMLRTNLSHVCEHDRISLLSSGTANAITNTLVALLNGAALLSFDVKKDSVTRLANWLLEEKITICPMSSPLFRTLCATLAGNEEFPDLRVIRLRSEGVYKTDVDLYKKYFHRSCIFVTGLSSNETGPLRDYLVDHESEINGSEVPVGYAAVGKELVLLNDCDEEIGFNEVGEIAVRSQYVVPGYLRRPELTRAKFKLDPSGSKQRLYRTGDLGLMLPDGCLVYKGRKDFRIKIRGYGVDTLEVETALRAHPAVREAVVVPQQSDLGETYLLAYFTPSSRPAPSVSELGSFLRQTLADYMIPSAFVMLDSMPLTPHNKVDRSALPTPGHSRPQLDTAFVAPRTEVEQELARIWAEVLCLDKVGVDDNFFDLGGHSLAASRIISRVINAFGKELPIKALFDAPSVAEMAAVIMSQPQLNPGHFQMSQAKADRSQIRPIKDFVEFKTEEIEQSVPACFEKIVRLYPNQLAIKSGDRLLTYEGLNQAANRIARAILTKRGEGSEPIALLFEHGIDVVAAIFGVLKAGKFYLTLSPSFPMERNTYMLEDSQAALIVTNRRNADLARSLTNHARTWLIVDDTKDSFSPENIARPVSPDTMAILSYTSGSTGNPKGVIEAHRNILYGVLVHTHQMYTCPQDRLSLIHSVSFGSAKVNLFQSLLNGASLFLFDVKSEGIHRLAMWLREEQITVFHSSPALFRQLADAISGQNRFPCLRVIHLTGAPITRLDFDLFKKHFSPETLLDIAMGSTEAKVICTYTVRPDFSFPEDGYPLGYPSPGHKVFLIDENGHEVGPNEVGEIVVKSRYLAAGYWKRPELNKTKFFPDPSGADERIYLTGDLGRMSADGFLVHVGRKDLQIKIRGHRVEIAEIERALLEHPNIKEAGVVARDREPGEKYLIAYVVARQNPAPRINALYDFLKKKLPDYMLPSTFVFLHALPLTNGKLDRTALPLPGQERPDLRDRCVPPQGDTEQKLVQIWTSILNFDQFGVHDSFFHIGGHSLSAMRVLSRILDDFQVDLSFRAFFDAPTVAALAGRIHQAQMERAEQSSHRSVEFNPFPDNEAALSFAAAGAAPIPETEVSDLFKAIPDRSEEQRAIRAKCVHPTGTFVEFTKEEAEQSIPQRFEKIVRLYPDRLAIKAKDRALTYDELNGAANRIAAQILAKQRNTGEPVALLFEQGIEAITGILGILKAGRFYVALDPSFPARRLASILEDSGAGLLLTDQQNIRMGSELANNRCQLLDVDASETNVSTDNPSLFLSPETLACIMYTSGSSGQPKGVVHNHRSILHWVKVHTNQLRICPSDRLTLLQSCSVASCVHNLFGSLLNGASLFPFDPRLQALHLARWLMDEQITIYHSIPTVFRQMTDTLTGPEEFPDLRVIRLSGMAITREDVERYKKHFSPNCVLLHVMGTTEAGTVPHYFIDKLTQVVGTTVPVGYAAEETEIILLDDNGRELGLGQMGEIAIKSRYLAPGYWERPELTNSKFLPDPGCAEQRIYLTGDLGRRAPDGCLFLLGRKDLQVKVRGYRIETREVEMRLLDHADIKDAVVVGRESQPGEAQLVAYFVPTGDRAPGISELRSFLQEKLPDYMVPSAFVPLHALPLTPNGKVDWKLLPPPGNARPEVDAPFVPPGKPVEIELARIWAELLGIDQVGIHDNFFELGGDSLLAARALSRVFHAYQVDVPLNRFFATPTVAALAVYLERPRRPQGTETQSIEPVSRDGPLPLSFAQQRLWFLEQLDPGNFAYNLFSAFQLKGQLNVKALEQSFNEIIRRHEALRTVFTTADRQPLQTILSSLTIQIPVVDLRHITAGAERDAELRRFCAAEAQRPFDLRCGPLLRVTVVRLTEDESTLLLIRHHIVHDGWSAGVLFRELSVLYAAFCRGNPSPLPELATQYRDFALWQRHWLQGKILAKQLHYWKQQLDDLPILQLPTDRPRSVAQSSRGGCQWFVLRQTLSQSLKTLSHREGVTPFMTLLAAFQTLIHRYAGQSDIAIGSPVAGRKRPELESLIGFFLNILVLRTDLSGNPTFRELVARVREVCLSAYEHQDLPFEKLVEELHPERNLSHNPLFQVTFALQNTPKSPLDLAGLTTTNMEVDPGIARFDLHLFLEEDEDTLKGYWNYNTDLFDPEMISRMVAHFQRLLEAIVADPDQRIGELPLLTEPEQQQVLVEWNPVENETETDGCLHELFEAQVERTPDAVAIVFESSQLTYRELNTRANKLGHYLRKLGVGPDVLVSLYMERSPDTVVAVLGILKAGGAYVPIDPQHPKDRLAFILEDSRSSVLLTQLSLFANVPKTAARVVCFDRDWDAITQESAENPHGAAIAENLAYAIYTSGSTGRPKGVLLEHRNVTRLFAATRSSFRFGERDVWTCVHSLAFDFSVWELWGGLLYGGRLVMVPHWVSRSPQAFQELLSRQRVTVLNQTPSAFGQLMQAHDEPASQAQPLTLRLVIFGGEALDMPRLKPWFDRYGDRKPSLVNMYGITETTVHVTSHPITMADLQKTSGSLIGHPLADLQIYILDQYLQPVPVGIPGEIYVAGAGLARGYLHRPELSAERFIAHPHSNKPGARLYRTGDLARYRPDGNIEFLGRTDDQVKIRGFRIEPGEIEAVLNRHDSVRAAVVVAREDIPGEKRLVAYIASDQRSAFSPGEIRRFLKQKLPEYMIPAAFVFVDSLPLTPNGKINRSALPLPGPIRPELQRTFVAPRTPLEASLATIWAELLHLDRVGVHDNFFDLGGHSLLATQVMSRIRDAFQIDIPLRALFEQPTVEELAIATIHFSGERITEKELSGMLDNLESLSEDKVRQGLV